MINRLFFAFVILIFSTALLFSNINEKAQKFKVSYTITHNEITLQEAADFEKKIRENLDNDRDNHDLYLEILENREREKL